MQGVNPRGLPLCMTVRKLEDLCSFVSCSSCLLSAVS